VRIWMDDGETTAGEEQIIGLRGHPEHEVRVFIRSPTADLRLVSRSVRVKISAPRLSEPQ